MPLVSVQSLSVSFSGLHALDSVSLEVRESEILALIGPNGAGKTTLVNCITGLYRPTSGSIAFTGIDLSRLRPDQIAQKGIARTFQNVELFRNLTVLDNLLIAQHCRTKASILSCALKIYPSRSEERSIRSTAQEILDFLGVLHLSNEMAGSLPLGSQKLVELGRAMALGPRLLLLDEPASGMNENESKQLGQLIQLVREKFATTILLIEHDMKLVMGISDRICVLDFGKKIAEGCAAEVRSNPDVIKAYLGMEHGSAETH